MARRDFFGVIFEDETEAVVEFQFKVTQGTYGTNINGGYDSASCAVEASSLRGYPIFTKSLYKHFVIFDSYGTRTYEGKIVRANDRNNTVSLDALGYFSEANITNMGLLYPTPGDGGVATSISDIIEDGIALISTWRQFTVYITQTTTDITPQDFFGEAKVKDAIEEVLNWGDDSTPPVPLHFQLWDNRTPYLVTRSSVDTDEPDFSVTIRENIGSDLTSTLSTEKIYNKIQVLYDDPDIGQDFTSWYQDADSQARWGVREGTYTLGETLPSLAGLVGELALDNFKDPEYSVNLTLHNIQGIGYSQGPRPIYKLRGNDILRISDLPTRMVSSFGAPSWGLSEAQGLVVKTSYNMANDTMQVTLGSKNPRFDALMTRLGLGTGDVS